MTPFTVRLICSAILILCALVVLGISAHVENSVRTFGTKTSTFSYDAFVGAFTALFEVIFIIVRFARPNSSIVGLSREAGFAGLLSVFWLASGIATTVFTEDGRSLCRNLDNIFDDPELKDLPPAVLIIVRQVFDSVCRELHAELAFIWIGWLVATFTFGYTIILAMRQQARGNKAIWRTSFKGYDQVAHSTTDPFLDPIGSTQGRVVGVVQPEEDPDWKP